MPERKGQDFKIKSLKKVKSQKTDKTNIKTKPAAKRVKKPKPDLKSCIIDAIHERKGEDIVVINFENIQISICDYFIICQGSSNRQVDSIADNIEEVVRKKLGIKPAHKEGYENAQWILLDYFDIVVHIFQPETREFYQLESLWADAETIKIN